MLSAEIQKKRDAPQVRTEERRPNDGIVWGGIKIIQRQGVYVKFHNPATSAMQRVSVYVAGFNLYYGLKQRSNPLIVTT